MKQKLSKEEQSASIKNEIEKLNNECAEKMANIVGKSNTRILSYSKQQELDKTIEFYTKKIAKLVVDLEELDGIEE